MEGETGKPSTLARRFGQLKSPKSGPEAIDRCHLTELWAAPHEHHPRAITTHPHPI